MTYDAVIYFTPFLQSLNFKLKNRIWIGKEATLSSTDFQNMAILKGSVFHLLIDSLLILGLLKTLQQIQTFYAVKWGGRG
jgi:hypothetical protein